MYAPLQIGIPADVRSQIEYKEYPLPEAYKEAVFYIWELRTTTPLAHDCEYLVLPDVSTDIIFDLYAQSDANKVFVMASGSDAFQINLGTTFHYVGIRFLPSVVSKDIQLSNADYATWVELQQNKDTADMRTILEQYVQTLLDDNRATKSWLMYRILSRVSEIRKVSDIEILSGYTGRQLQRIFTQKTGFTPSDFIKIVRFQGALSDTPELHYADQSHLIKEFKRITGLTPKVFKATY